MGVDYELKVCSAHRDPDRLVEVIQSAEKTGCLVFIAAAGMAAHLAGAVSAHTTRPVIGIPVGSGPLKGQDSLLSTVMMPPGIPVATVGIDGGKNAAWLACQIIAIHPDHSGLRDKLLAERKSTRAKLLESENSWNDEIK
jgi:5-(carboxyamino)imidazole ribonucleotide mutase